MRESDPQPVQPHRTPRPARPLSSTAEGRELARSGGGSVDWQVSGMEDRGPTGPRERLGLGSIGPYELLDELARGGMGVVYRGRHTELDRQVAIKVLLAAERASHHQLTRFQTEARAAARLRHPAIVAVHEVGVHEGCAFIVMDLIEGQSLGQLLEDHGALPERRAAELTRTLAEALELAHREGVLHRDIKPANVLISAETGQPFLTDFGLAKELDSGSDLTRTGQFMGTPGYCAPEQMRGQIDRVDGRADQYGLGATLYAMLTARAPIVGDTAVATIAQMMDAEVKPPSLHRPDLSPDLETICLKAMETEPEARYPSAAALAADLTRFLGDEPIAARRPSPVERLRRWSRRNRGVARALGGGALALLAVALGAAAWSTRRGAEAELQRAVEAATEQKERRRRALREAREQVQALLRTCGERSLGGAERDEAVVALSRARSLTTAAELRDALLRAVREALLPAEREVMLAVEQPTPAEARAGAEPLRALRAALERQAKRDPGEPLSAEHRAALQAARLRIRQRAIQRKGERLDIPTRRYAQRLIANRQAQLLGPHGPQRLEVVCRALGTLRLDEGAVDALGRYLRAEADPARAVFAVDALSRFGGARPQQFVFRALERFPIPEFVRALTQPLRRLAGTPIDEDDPDQLAGRARIKLARNERDAALADLTRALELRPRDARLWHQRGDLHYMERRWAQAERDFTEGLALAPRDAKLRARRARARSLLGRHREAAADLEEALRIDPYDVDVWVQKALLLMTQHRFRDAQEVASRAIRMDPLHPEAWYQRGRADKALKEYRAAVSDYTRAIELDPNFAKAWRNRGSARRRLKEFAAARRDLDKAVALDARNPWGRVYRGNLRILTGDPQGALDDYDAALKVLPSLARAWMDRAAALLRLRRLPEAGRSAQKAVDLAPQDAAAWVVHGDVLRAQRRWTPAEDAYTRALKLNAEHDTALGNRALVRLARRDLDGALADAEGCLKLIPESISGLTNRGLIRKARGELKQAEADFDRALKLDPGFAPAYVARADLYLRTQRPARALEDLSKATSLDPKLAEAWLHRAALLRSMSRHSEALKDADRALALNPKLAQAWGIRGLARAGLSDRRGAIADLEQYLKLAPATDPERKRIEARLSELRRR